MGDHARLSWTLIQHSTCHTFQLFKKETMEKKINHKIQKLIDRATNLNIDLDDFIEKYVTPKLIIGDRFEFKRPHQIGRYFVCTGLCGQDAYGEVLRNNVTYIPLRVMSIWEKERLIKVLQEEGFFQ